MIPDFQTVMLNVIQKLSDGKEYCLRSMIHIISDRCNLSLRCWFIGVVSIICLFTANPGHAQKLLFVDSVKLDTKKSFTKEQRKLFSRDSIIVLEQLQELREKDQRYRKHWHKGYRPYKEDQFELDSTNTLKLIEIVKMYGFPTTYRLGSNPLNLSPYIVFVHAPESFFGVLTPLVKKEYRKKRMSKFEYDVINWQLTGRE